MTRSRALGTAVLMCSTLCASMLVAQAPGMRDSADVRIVENAARASAPITFRLGAKRLEVGGLEDNPSLEFDHNQGYLRGALLADGGLAVIDVSRVHFFDAKGTRRAVVGRLGSGPEDFRYLMGVCRVSGDTIAVYDSHNKRVSLLTTNAKIVHTFQLEPNWSTPFEQCYGDGTLLFTRSVPAAATEPVQTHQFFRTTARGEKVGREFTLTSRRFDMVSSMGVDYTAGGADLLYADARTQDIRSYNSEGKLRRIIRTRDVPAAVTAAQAESRMTGSIPNNVSAAEREERMARMKARPYASTWPTYLTVKSDPAGRTWAEDYPVPSVSMGRWTAFDRDGRMIGRLMLGTLPGDARPPQVISFGENVVLLRRRDTDGAAYLSVYAIDAVDAPKR